MNDDDLQPELLLQAFCYRERNALLPELGCAIDNAGGWLLDRKPTSASAVELHLETQLHALPEIYAALLGSGVELTRDSHRTLAERCNCSLHLPAVRGAASILSLRIELHFLSDPARTADVSRLLAMHAATA